MRAKFVNEDFKDILKPKSLDDIKRDHQTLIFWKRIIDGARSPKSIKYFLDKEFIKDKAKERGLNQPIRKDWQKQLLYFLDIIDEEKEKKGDEITQELVRKVYSHTRDYGRNGINAPAAFYVDIKNYINNKYKEVNTKYKRYTGNELKEGLLGDYLWKDRQGESHFIEVYENPKSIKRLEPDVRGISDKEGNLYVLDHTGFIHERILDYVKSKKLMEDAGWDYDNHYYVNMIAWQRMRGTNDMYLGESYSENKDVIYLDWFKELVDKVRTKNPHINFIEESIYDARL